jgi:capsular polysaccharide biosynthesis protein
MVFGADLTRTLGMDQSNVTPGDLGTRFVYRNPLDLTRISYADIVANAAEGVHVEQPETVRLFPRAAPIFHDDPDGVGLFRPFHDIVVTYPPVFTTSLRDVTLVGFRSVLSRDGFFLNDVGHLGLQEIHDFVRSLGRSNEIGHLVPVGDEGVFSHAPNGQPEVHLEGPVVLLTSGEAGNFGSFLYRDLIKLVNLIDIPANWRFLIHIAEDTYAQFLDLAGLEMRRVIRHDPRTVYHIDQAIIPGLRNPFALADPQTRAFYDGLRARCDSGARGRRLYISRHSINAGRPTGRVMLNEAELIERLRPIGFEIVEPQYLTATEQIAAFASADLVVGPSGSGMFNAVFCRPGTKLIDIESEPHWIYPHCCLFASSGLQYGIFEGLAANRDWSVHHKPWQVNIEALLRRIATFAPQEGTPMSDTLVPNTPPEITEAARAPLWSVPDLTGEDYTTVLQRFHKTFRPKNYLEIGVSDGASLELANCFSIAIDPSFAIHRPAVNNKPGCCFYQMTSDNFFQKYDPTAILGQSIDMAFLDGMHWFEYLLRDFINVERHCNRNSVIFMHDCMPTDEYIGRRDMNDHVLKQRSAHPDWWAGDVWKTLAILLKFRPDLRIVVFNASPTGLIAVTRLDPSSTLLADQYYNLVEEYKDRTLTDHGDAYYNSMMIVDTGHFVSFSTLSTLFWL